MERPGHIFRCDFSGLEGARRYCSDESAARIRSELRSMPLQAVHDIGTGDFHYITLFWLERIDRPFVLVLCDNHPDDQPGAFGDGLLSCGGWVRQARELPFFRGEIWLDGNGEVHEYGPLDAAEAYFSIDLDVLGEQWARTNWNQGSVSLAGLTEFLKKTAAERSWAGADICGGIPEDCTPLSCDLELNCNAREAAASVFL